MTRTITDEMVHEYLKANRDGYGGWPYYDLSDVPAHLVERTRRGLAAALSVAPTTDEPEADSIDWFVKFQDAARQSSIHAGDAAYAEHMLQEALDFAALWKETARHLTRKIHDEDGLVMRAIRGGQHCNVVAEKWKARAEKAEHDARDARTYAVEQVEAAQAETTEAVQRAEEAEQERDTARKFQRVIAKDRDDLWDRLAAESMTAREHLDAALREDVMIAQRLADNLRALYPDTPMATVDITEAVIEAFNPPTPTRPEGAEALVPTLRRLGETSKRWLGEFSDDDLDEFADALASEGVRVTEDGEDL